MPVCVGLETLSSGRRSVRKMAHCELAAGSYEREERERERERLF
jgi:hypothetical protein